MSATVFGKTMTSEVSGVSVGRSALSAMVVMRGVECACLSNANVQKMSSSRNKVVLDVV